MSEFGKALRAARLAAGKTLAELAAVLEHSVAYVSDVERGQRAPFPSDNTIRRAAQFLSTDEAPLLLHAAEARGHFALRTEGMSERHLRVGAALARAWGSLTSEELQAIYEVIA